MKSPTCSSHWRPNTTTPAGNNTPVTLYRVSRATAGKLETNRVRLGLQHHPALELRALADGMRHFPFAAELTESIFTNPALAHLLISETWENRTFTGPEERDADPRRLADILGSVEVRYCVGVMGARWIALSRVRGAQPQLIEPEGDSLEIGGRMFDALKDYHQAIAAHWRHRLATNN